MQCMNCILVQMCVCTDVCTDVYIYIAGRALYMYVHDLANPLMTSYSNILGVLFLRPLNVSLH
jgi:hypothetical protein